LKFLWGTTQYHLNESVKSGKVISVRGRVRKFYFANGVFSGTNPSQILQILSQDTARKILLLIIMDKHLTQSNLAKKLGISTPSVSWAH